VRVLKFGPCTFGRNGGGTPINAQEKDGEWFSGRGLDEGPKVARVLKIEAAISRKNSGKAILEGRKDLADKVTARSPKPRKDTLNTVAKRFDVPIHKLRQAKGMLPFQNLKVVRFSIFVETPHKLSA
jgi:hypothetical protein